MVMQGSCLEVGVREKLTVASCRCESSASVVLHVLCRSLLYARVNINLGHCNQFEAAQDEHFSGLRCCPSRHYLISSLLIYEDTVMIAA